MGPRGDELVEIDRRINKGVEHGEGPALFARQFVAEALIRGLDIGGELPEAGLQVVPDLGEGLVKKLVLAVVPLAQGEDLRTEPLQRRAGRVGAGGHPTGSCAESGGGRVTLHGSSGVRAKRSSQAATDGNSSGTAGAGNCD